MTSWKRVLTKCAAIMVMLIMTIWGSTLPVTAAGESDDSCQTEQRKFSTDCIVDEIGWIKDEEDVLKGLEQFHRITGFQPYIVLSKESPENKRVAERISEKYYETNFFRRSDVVLYTYFSNNSDYLYYGKDVSCKYNNILKFIVKKDLRSIFNKAADDNWYKYEDKSEMLSHVFSDTAEILETTELLEDKIFGTVSMFVPWLLFVFSFVFLHNKRGF